jgi:hypothetical protein
MEPLSAASRSLRTDGPIQAACISHACP